MHSEKTVMSHSVVATREILALLTQVRILMGQQKEIQIINKTA